MTPTKNKITTKLVISYLLAISLSVIAFVLFYQQLSNFTNITKGAPNRNEHVFLISKTITNLYEVEALGRNLIKGKDSTDLDLYQMKVNEINEAIDQLVKKYPDSSRRIQINSIKDLLRRKNISVEQLTNIYNNKSTEDFYTAAVKELKQVDPTFRSYKYTNRFKEFKPHQRRYLIKLLDYSKQDNENKISNKTVDSIAESVTNVLINLARKERAIQKRIESKEQEIIENDRVLTTQMRSMLTDLEWQELQEAAKREEESQKVLSQTSRIILFSTLLSLLTALTFIYFINKDVKKNAKQQEQLAASKAYAERLLTSKENLMNMVTHDVRAPLHSILGYLELLSNSNIEEKELHYINQAQKSSDYMLHLVNDLLDFSKVEAGKLSIESVTFQPSVVIENAIKQSIPSEDAKDLKIVTTIDEALKRLFLSDPYRIKQIATNLISNAYKFTPSGFMTIDASLVPKNQNNYLKLMVSDSGIGITKEKQKHIFEAFSQGDISSTVYEGFGLGLYITKNLVDLLGGTLSLESELGKGSSFTCFLPLQESNSVLKESTSVSIAKRDDFVSIESIHILIVDDDMSQLGFLQEILSHYKIPHTAFQDVEKAVTFAQQHKPDLVFTDIQMPINDGFSFLKLLKAHESTSSIPVIALTGNTEKSEQEFIEKGFTKRFLKPYKPDHLIASIRELINVEIFTSAIRQLSKVNLVTTSYDLTDMALFLEQDMDAVKKILGTFLTITYERVVKWEQAIPEKDFDTLKDLAHKMNPMFTQVKAEAVYKNLRVIERTKETETIGFYGLCTETLKAVKTTIADLELFMEANVEVNEV
ncbi:ATP-binding response regulator [Aquimarina agarilytica]|uniref:ATP-binding response regulator n=1 Tax=Aquimarina agarilytica TaxID=1087449 RepID=UPI0002884531|nr:ATP-binding protein [Aquimarina agarilytica]